MRPHAPAAHKYDGRYALKPFRSDFAWTTIIKAQNNGAQAITQKEAQGMNEITRTVSGEKLATIVDLPEPYKDQRLELTIRPVAADEASDANLSQAEKLEKFEKLVRLTHGDRPIRKADPNKS